MLRQDVGTFCDRNFKALCSAPRRDLADQRTHTGGPDLWCNLSIDPRVGDDLGIAFGQRYKDQDPGPEFGMLQTTRNELPQRFLVRALTAHLSWHEQVADAVPRREVKHEQEGHKL